MIKVYDFKSPKKFTKERMSMIENLYEGFSRSLGAYLTGLLQVFCDVSVAGIEESRYQEYGMKVGDTSLFGLLRLEPGNPDYSEASMVMQMEPRLGFFMIERLLGGAGTKYELDRAFTDIEKAILRHLIEQFTSLAEDAWRGYLDVTIGVDGMESNTHLLQMSAPEDIVVVVNLDIHIRDLEASVKLVMPAANMEELTSKFGFKYAQSLSRNDESQKMVRRGYIVQNMLDSEVELKAILHQFPLDTQEILQLQVGDIVPINKNINSDIRIMVEDVASFQGKPGHTKVRKAVKISKVL